MTQAPSTWALVVGIDTYDEITHLTGAARDAAAIVGWLRALGVPDDQILLHTAPNAAAKAEIEALGLWNRGCTEPEIWSSFERLMDGEGARLFVFLCGHGLFEPGGARVFLTREASQKVTRNLGIDWYARFLRGLPYTQQFLFMDGCLNLPYTESERAQFQEGKQASVQPSPPRPDVAQIFCFAASQGQRALEDGQRGLFTKILLETLDPEKPSPFCLDIDDRTGSWQLDLARAMDDVVKPRVTRRATELQRRQHPGYDLIAGGTTRSVVIAQPAGEHARVRVTLDPDSAANDVERLMLWAEGSTWRRELPDALSAILPLPHECVLPASARVAVRCTIRDPQRWVQPPLQEFRAQADTDVVFRLEPPPLASADTTFTIRTVTPSGDPVPGMTDAASERVIRLAEDAEPNVSLKFRANGSLLSAAPGDSAAMYALALDVAQAVNDATPPDVRAILLGVDAAELPTTLEFSVTPHQTRMLAGFLNDEPLLEIDGNRMSLRQLCEHASVYVDPGPTTVRITLPWGTWATQVVAREGAATKVRLPRTIGIPPLRVKLHERTGAAGSRAIVWATSPTGDAWLKEPTGELLNSFEPPAPAGTTRAAVSSPPAAARHVGRWEAYAAVSRSKHRLVFALNEYGPVAVKAGRAPRAEPLADTPSPWWDRLVSSGQLDRLSREEAIALTKDKWAAPLLGLAGAYACYASELDEHLPEVLENLESLDPTLPDTPLLNAALDRRKARHRQTVNDALNALQKRDTVPLFRWGVGIGVLAAEHYENKTLAAKLSIIERRLVPSSAWTMWRAPMHPNARAAPSPKQTA